MAWLPLSGATMAPAPPQTLLNEPITRRAEDTQSDRCR